MHFSWPPPLLHIRSRHLLHLHLHPFSTYSTYIFNTHLKALIQSHHIAHAHHLFDEMPHWEKDHITWTTLISAYLHHSNPLQSLSLFSQLHSDPSLIPDQFALNLALKASSSSPSFLPTGLSLHSLSIKLGEIPSSVFVTTALLDFYSKSFISPLNALKVFGEMRVRNVVSWTAAITALVRAGCYHNAVRLFAEMRRGCLDVICDSHTFAIVFKAISDAGLLRRGKEVHLHVVKSGLGCVSFVANSLATMYSKCGDLAQAVVVFERMDGRDVVSWTSIISTYVQMGRENEAVHSFVYMQVNDGVKPNEYTYAAVLSGFIELLLGEQLHAQVMHKGFLSARTVGNTLVTFYSRAGQLTSADTLFWEMSSKDIVSWSAIISAYAQFGYTEESFFLFSKMRTTGQGILPTEFQLASLLSSCASTAMLDSGRQVHGLLVRVGVESEPNIASALVNVYSKCGTIDEAHRVFEEMKSDNVVSWTAMINGYAEHGHSYDAINLFDRMIEIGLVPDHVAYIGVLTACSHVGLVDLGLKYFETMKYRMEPWKEHYGCVIDLLGRAGRLREAEKLIKEMPWRADEVVWTAMLRASAVHGDTDLGRRAAEKVLEIEPECAGAHIALSNIYAAKGRWGEAAGMRRAMRGKGVRKEAGWSWIGGVGDGLVTVFTSADRTHSMVEKIYAMLGLVYFEAKMARFVSEIDSEDILDHRL